MKTLKWIIGVLLVLFIVVEAYILLSGKRYLNTLLPLTIFSGKLGPDIDELNHFKSNEVKIATPQPWALAKNYNSFSLPDSVLKRMEEYKTVSFLVIKNDSVLYDRNWENYDVKSTANSFSMAKSITSMLIGCALHDGLIKSVDEPVSNYITNFSEGDLSKITIKDLLTMSSGLGFKEDYSSMFSWPAEAYYGPDVNGLTLEQAIPEMKPGTIWKYKGGDTQLLGMILKKVTGKTVAEYASEKLWQPLGAEYPAFWSLDENGMEKVSCCWYATSRDFARLAKLMMQHGKWNGQTIIDSAYVAQSLKPAELLDKNGQPTRQYGFQWWLMDYKNHPIFYARGIRGQYIFAIPDEQLIVVRLGHKRAEKQGDELPPDIFLYLDAALGMHN